MREKPILFNTQMVQAILDGRKTMTRRIVKPQGIKCYKGVYAKLCNVGYLLNTAANSLYCPECGNIIEYSPEGKDYCKTIDAPYSKGDILWVRETWQDLSDNEGEFVYLADGDKGLEDRGWGVITTKDIKWKPSIYMPRDAARLFLKVTNVRVERLQDITPADCIAEGIINPTCEKCLSLIGECKPQSDVDVFCGNDEQLIDRYADLWNSLNAKRGYDWETNPWVWMITFEKIEGGINNE